MQRNHLGVTLLELMTAIAVLAILFGVGVPAFTTIVRNNQLAAESNDLVQALTYARSEAVTRGVRVSVCAANEDQSACSEDPSWHNGWIVFADDFGDAGEIDASDVVIDRYPAPSNVAVNGSESFVSFTRLGRAEFSERFEVTRSTCTDQQRRSIQVGISGRVGLQHTDCSVTLEDELEADEPEEEGS